MSELKIKFVEELVMNEWSGWIVRQRGWMNVSACSRISDVYRITKEGLLCVSVCVIGCCDRGQLVQRRS